MTPPVIGDPSALRFACRALPLWRGGGLKRRPPPGLRGLLTRRPPLRVRPRTWRQPQAGRLGRLRPLALGLPEETHAGIHLLQSEFKPSFFGRGGQVKRVQISVVAWQGHLARASVMVISTSAEARVRVKGVNVWLAAQCPPPPTQTPLHDPASAAAVPAAGAATSAAGPAARAATSAADGTIALRVAPVPKTARRRTRNTHASAMVTEQALTRLTHECSLPVCAPPRPRLGGGIAVRGRGRDVGGGGSTAHGGRRTRLAEGRQPVF